MATTTTKTARDLTAELVFLTRALKAPSLREAAGRLAERARAEGWTHEEFLAARSPHGSPTAARAASAKHASRPASRWRSSTSTTPGH
jgi:hypothetical protein